MFKLYCVTAGKQYDITPLVGTFSWSSSHRELAQKINFSIAFNDDRYFPIIPVSLESLVVLYKGKQEVLRGLVVDETRKGRGERDYTGMDFAFYLNRSTETYQFNGMAASAAIAKICADAKIPVGKIAPIPFRITKIYTDTTLADIVNDIRQQVEEATGVEYRLEMRSDGLHVGPQTAIVVTPRFLLYPNGPEYAGGLSISGPSRARKLEGDAPGAAVIETASVTMLGDITVRAGRILELNEPVTGLIGKYLILDVTHTVQGGVHTMTLGLEVA